MKLSDGNDIGMTKYCRPGAGTRNLMHVTGAANEPH